MPNNVQVRYTMGGEESHKGEQPRRSPMTETISDEGETIMYFDKDNNLISV